MSILFSLITKFKFALAILLLLSMSLLACRAAPATPAFSSASTVVNSTPEVGSLTFTLWHSETGAARETLEALAGEFHVAYPDLTITTRYVGSDADLAKQVTAAIALGHAPDLVLAPRRSIAQFARQNGLIALDNLRADPAIGLSDDDTADFFPGLLDEGALPEYHNQLYAMPFDEQALVLFYNADLLQAANVDVPTTWDSFADAASRLTQDQQYGWEMQDDADVFAAMLLSRNSSMLDPQEQHPLFGGPSGEAILTLASQLNKSGAARVESDRDAAFVDFAQGNAAFLFDWMSRVPPQQNLNFTVGITTLPQSDLTNPYMLAQGEDLAILKMPPERAHRAWFFIRWLTATAQSARWARNVGAIPLRASALTLVAADLLNNPRFRELGNRLQGATPHFVSRAAHPRAVVIEQIMEDAWAQAVLGKADIPATLDAASARANQILASSP